MRAGTIRARARKWPSSRKKLVRFVERESIMAMNSSVPSPVFT